VKKLVSPLIEFGSVRFAEYKLNENLLAAKIPNGFVLRRGGNALVNAEAGYPDLIASNTLNGTVHAQFAIPRNLRIRWGLKARSMMRDVLAVRGSAFGSYRQSSKRIYGLAP
jgi:hypothetical protein